MLSGKEEGCLDADLLTQSEAVSKAARAALNGLILRHQTRRLYSEAGTT